MSHTYEPAFVKDSELRLELQRLQRALNDAQPDFVFQVLHGEPSKTFPGQTLVADGSDWNPGYGPGKYRRTAANDGWIFEGPYVTGSGGTVTQATSKSTGVTLNKPCGEITMNGAALAAATIVSFTLTNSTIAATDLLVLNHVSGGTLGAYGLNAACGNGSAVIYVRNNTGGSLSQAIVIRFKVEKAATS